MNELVSCPLCDGNRNTQVLTAPCIVDPKQQFCIVQCDGCGAAYTNPRPTPDAIGNYYPPGYDCHVVDGLRHCSRRGRLRQKLTNCVLRTWYGYADGPVSANCRIGAWLGWLSIRRSVQRCQWIRKRGQGRLLDFGCGAGAFLRDMRSLGWSVEGIDASARVARDVESETGIPVHVGSLPHAALTNETFDVITMWSSLEHVHSPRTVIRAARRLLSPGGRLIVAVPNFGGWASRLFGENWFGVELPRHLTFFTPASLTRLLAAESMRIESIRHVAMDGWNRQSARLASARGTRSWLARGIRWKPLAVALSNWGQYTHKADMIVTTAVANGNKCQTYLP